MNIDHLPPELLAIILSDEQIPLRQCIALRSVSSHWLATLEENVLKLTTKLELNEDDYYNRHENHLPFTTQSIPHLTRLFPIVANLSVSLKPGSPYQELPQFLTHFRSTLKTLKLWNIEIPSIRLTELLRHLSSLENLSELCLSAAYQQEGTQLSLPSETDRRLLNVRKLTWGIQLEPVEGLNGRHPWAALAAWFLHLEQLILESEENVDFLKIQLTSSMLRELLPLEHLTELSLSHIDPTSALTSPNSTDRLFTHVKKLNLMFFWFDVFLNGQESQIISSLTAWFPNLASFNVGFHQEDYETDDGYYPLIRLTIPLLRNLARLKCLTALQLPRVRSPEYIEAPLITDRRLTSLKSLNVEISDEGFDDGQHCIEAISAWCPRLEELTVCRPDDNAYSWLTSNILRALARLECLTSLQLPKMFCEKYLEAPSRFDRPLTSLKSLKLLIYDDPGELDSEHCISAIAAWCPRLEELIVHLPYSDNEDFCPVKFQLTTSMLRGLANLEYLSKLHLPLMLCKKKHLDAPLPTERRLTCLKKLILEIADLPAEFDGQHCVSVVAAWCPRLKELTVQLPFRGGSCHFQLTSNMLRDLVNLQYLDRIDLPMMLYKKEHLEVASPTDRPLTCLSLMLSLRIADSPLEFDIDHFTSAISAWFPRVMMLMFKEYYPNENYESHKFPLTGNMLHGLANLKRLGYLNLSSFFYEKKYLEMPLPTDRPLTSLQSLNDLIINDSPEDFDGEHFCSTLAAWFPRLQILTLCINDRYSGECKDKAAMIYYYSIEANRHHFGDSSNFKWYFSWNY